MIQAFVIASVILLGTSLLGCTFLQAPVVPPTAFVYTGFDAPLDVDFEEKTTLGSKQDTASTVSILGMVSWGDASSATAAKEGDIQTIRHADYRYTSVLGVFTRFTTIVYGD